MLGRLIGGSLPIPNGFCVSVASYERWLSENSRERFDRSDKTVPKVVRDDFRRAWYAIGWNDTRPLVAVRSSAIGEDSSLASFAGQYRTYLNISGVDEALRALRLCWESAGAAHAQQYAKERGVSDRSTMGVLIQEMIPAEASGVAFSVDPVSGDQSVCYTEMVHGLGESLVSGESEPDALVWTDHEGNVLRYDALSDVLPLPIHELARLISLVDRVKQIAEGAQDIEWAWTRLNSFQLLQARPIASGRTEAGPGVVPRWRLPGRPVGGWSEDIRYVFGYWDEYNARSIAPLNWDLYESAAWEANIRMFDYLGSLPHVEQVAVMHDGVPVAIDPSGSVHPPPGEARVRVEMSPIVDWEATFAQWASKATVLRSQIAEMSSLEDERLLLLLNEASTQLRGNLAQRMAVMGQWINPRMASDPVQNTERRLRDLLSPFLKEPQISVVLSDLAAGVRHDTERMNTALLEITSIVALDPRLLGSASIEERVRVFLSQYGHFHSDGRTLEAHPGLLWNQLRATAESRRVPPSLTSDARKKHTRRVEMLRYYLPSAVFHDVLNATHVMRESISNRETSKARESLPRPLIELLCQECGRRLYYRGLIDKPNDVYLLRLYELHAKLIGSVRASYPTRVVLRNRRAIMKWKATRTWLPDRFHEQSDGPHQSTYSGEPGSPGTACGPARVVTAIDDFRDVKNGDIAIAYTTNPLWTQIFSRISGIVVERGGTTSHAAVVAREYGLPAVLGISGITGYIQTGEYLEVIGDRGLVRRIEAPKIRND